MSTSVDFARKLPQIQFHSIDDLRAAAANELRTSLTLEDQPERFLWENLRKRPRSASHHLSSRKIPSRRWLRYQAQFWRSLQTFGMRLHDLAPPKPPRPTFVRKIPTDTIPIQLYFYTPADYYEKQRSGHRYPVVVNFHGGGFCLGHATDDRYWARVVVERTDAVFVSVNYRRAPEHPFPTPVDDAVDSLLYLARNADMLGLDTRRTALSGFSAGANLAFAAPFRLRYRIYRQNSPDSSNEDLTSDASIASASPASQSTVDNPYQTATNEDPGAARTHRPPLHTLTSTFTPHPRPVTYPSNLRITSIVAWYPLLDWTQSRASKIRASVNPKACLPKHFTDLFDYSYLPPPDEDGRHCSPYASPGLAPDKYLRRALPDDIQIWLCEWDMLLAEGQSFAHRLESQGKDVEWTVIPGVPHGWDKSPNPWRDQRKIDRLYERSARGLKRVFDT